MTNKRTNTKQELATVRKLADGMLDDSIKHRVKEAVRKANAKLFFGELIVSLTNGKRKWTPAERMKYNRVAAFLDA